MYHRHHDIICVYMKHSNGIAPEIENMRVRGQYEGIATDTVGLAIELSSPRDLDRIIADFDQGFTGLRDVGEMCSAQRSMILTAYQRGTLENLAANHSHILSDPVQNLHQRCVSQNSDQPVGHNFFVNATGFIDSGLPWAKQFNELVTERLNTTIYHIAGSNDLKAKNSLLAAMTRSPDQELMSSIAVYLAGRSLAGEEFLESHYGQILDRAKNQAIDMTRSIGASTGLRHEMIVRAVNQLQRTAFGSFDHLQGLVTTDNTGTLGDYQIGTLRVEVQFDGSVNAAKLRQGQEVHHIIAHELQHAGSAQDLERYRCGLQSNGQGLEVNEGMTEYLAQLSSGSPGIELLDNGNMRIKPGVPYTAPVYAMLALHEQFKSGRNSYFALLFNAYHGAVNDHDDLRQALDAFYRYDAEVAAQLS